MPIGVGNARSAATVGGTSSRGPSGVLAVVSHSKLSGVESLIYSNDC